MNDLDLYVEKYLEHLRVRNYAGETMKGHKYALRGFRAYLSEMGVFEVAAVTPEILRDYQAAMKERVNWKGEPICPFSQNSRLKSVRVFFRYLNEENYLLGDPARGLKYAKQPKMLPRSILTIQEMRKLLAAPDTRTALGYRDRTILELMYSTGLRKGEVNHLKVTDVDTVDGFVRVIEGKWSKDRVVPLGKIASRWVENYVKAVRPMLSRETSGPHLFLTNKGKAFSTSAVWGVVTRHARGAGIEKRVTPHSLRHTCATLMMKNKANIRHIQELLGHALLESTQIYTQVAIVDLKEAHRKYHPREREHREERKQA